ncbi:MAG: DNA topoisomerase I [Chloroflexia bacterium]|nr:DNA topoisomerase I [Chloroflexia bacterium]
MLEQLVHNGVLVADRPPARGLVLRIRGALRTLEAKQEEMALAWAKKHGTPYVEDPVFVQNFMLDFSQALGLEEPLSLEEVDFEPAIAVVAAERAAREELSKEERKALAAERKVEREALREQYGYATVNGARVPLANYVVEPSGIFMGRGEHPLRGRWKEGSRESDITLNLSPDAPRPPGDWQEIVWQPESLWVARWRDALSGKLKYVWLSDTAPIKQEREREKFDQAHELQAALGRVRAQIARDLAAADPKQRMIATACYLIDALCLRVGDEKDEDEADTVGATTLRPEHVNLGPDGVAEFKFLGKDSVLWHKRLELPEMVRQNLAVLIENARPTNSIKEGHPSLDLPQIFPDISSRDVNAYLGEILPGLTAKVFRTHHATITVQESLCSSGVTAEHPEHKKWEAASLANLAAAQLCNHTKKESGSWPRSRRRYQEREQKAKERLEKYRRQVQECRQELQELQQEAEQEQTGAPTADKQEKLRALYDKRIERAQKRLQKARERQERAGLALGKIQAQANIAAQKRTWNLGTSLKSYIDPRVYHHWGQEVDYDVIECYYPQALRSRFSWAREDKEP